MDDTLRSTPPADRPILNLASYAFAPLHDAAAWRDRCLEHAQRHGLRGTVLVADEGINLCVAAAPTPVHAWFDAVLAHASADLADGLRMHAKHSWSATVPYERLRVKLKREIIRMNEPRVQPALGRASAVAPTTLARWLDAGRDDEGRPVVLLDTRNGFEVDAGHFDGALDWRLQKFSDFPTLARQHRDALEGRTVVTYCTGGIRCEKAALWLRGEGVAHVHQLDGGILRYLEQVPSAHHWRGRCFVFDARATLGTDLEPTPAADADRPPAVQNPGTS